MKKILFSLSFLSIGFSATAQSDFFALTGKTGQQIVFNDFRALDAERGVSGEIYLSSTSVSEVFSEVQNRVVVENKNSFNHAQSTAMASLAYTSDGKLVYMPMYTSNIYVLDTKTKKLSLVENTAAKTTSCDLASHFTRMTSGADGNVYALTNSGSQLIQISNKAGRYSVKDLGIVYDSGNNGENKISSMNTGYGGDMIADNDNQLYVFSASGNVFKVSSQSLKAEFVGKIGGLPEKFTVNAAAVNAKGEIILGSAKGESFYKVDMETLQAEMYGKNNTLPVYDFASNYLMKSNRLSVANKNLTYIYPTKVDEGFINIQFGENVKSSATVEIINAAGGVAIKKTFNTKDSVQKMDVSLLSTGVYIVNITDEKGKTVITQKILVTR